MRSISYRLRKEKPVLTDFVRRSFGETSRVGRALVRGFELTTLLL